MILQSYHCNNSERVGPHKVKFWMPNLHVLHFTLSEILQMMVNCNTHLLLWINILVFGVLFEDLLLNVNPSAGQHTSHISWNPKVHINSDPTPQPYTEPEESSPQLHPTSLISVSILPSHLHQYHRRKKNRMCFIQLQRPVMIHIWKSVTYVCYEGDVT